jgi:hypothetical protein
MCVEPRHADEGFAANVAGAKFGITGVFHVLAIRRIRAEFLAEMKNYKDKCAATAVNGSRI